MKFYTIDEVLQDLQRFERVEVNLNLSPKDLERFAKMDFVKLYSEHYLHPITSGHTVDDLRLRIDSFVFETDNKLPKNRDRDPDPDAVFTVYGYEPCEHYCDLKLTYKGCVNVAEEVFDLIRDSVRILVYNHFDKNITSFKRDLH